MKILKAIFSVICTIVLTVSLIALSGLILVRGVINKDTIMSIILPSNNNSNEETSYKENTTELAYVEIAYTEADLENIDYNKLQSISGDISKIHELFDSTFTEQGLPTELIDYIVEDNDYQEVLSDYLDQYLSYSTGNGPKPVIDQNRINTILNQNITKYEEETKTVVNTEKVEELVTKMTDKIDEQVDKVTENSKLKLLFDIVFSKKLLLGLIVNTLIWAVILVILNLNTSVLYYLGTASLLHGIAYIVIKLAIKVLGNRTTEFQSIINTVANLISSKINLYIILSIVIGIILIGIKIVLNLTTKKKLPE